MNNTAGNTPFPSSSPWPAPTSPERAPAPARRPRSRLLPVLEVLAWVVLVVTAFGSALAIGLMVNIDCNGLWGDRPDQACTNRKSWMAGIPIGVLALLVVARVKVFRRATERRAARGGDR